MSHVQAVMSALRTSILGAALVAVGPVTMAIYTPAMPTLVTFFGTTDAAVKLTLTAYFAGFAVTQLVCGPLSDAFGRKPVTLAFLSLYLASSVLATFSPTIEFMVLARTLQGVGAAIGISVARAIVRDQFSGQASARIMNAIAMMLALGPAMSPAIGGFVLELFGWREIFWCMIVYGVVLMAAVALFQVETNRFAGLEHLKPRQLAQNYALLLSDARFLGPSLLIGAGLGNIYALTTVLPFVLIYEIGLSPSEFGLTMMLQSGSFISGTIVTGRLLKRMDANRLVPFGITMIAISCVALCAMTLFLEPTIAGVMFPVGLFVFALAFVLPACMTDSLAPFPHIAGAASSMVGFLQFGGGIIASLFVAAIGDPVIGLATVLTAMPLTGVAGYLICKGQVSRAAAAE